MHDPRIVIEEMHFLSKKKAELDKYFKHCQLWQAIYVHIGYEKDCVLIKRKGMISVRKDAKVIELFNYYLSRDESILFLEFVIEYRENTIIISDSNFEEVKYRIEVPIDLLINFTAEKFDEWIDLKRKQRNTLLFDENFGKLRSLIESYPKEAKEIMDGLKTNSACNV